MRGSRHLRRPTPHTLNKGGGGGNPLVDGLDYFAASGATQAWYAGATQPNALYDAVSNKTFITWHTYDTASDNRFTHIRAYNHGTSKWEPVYSVGRATFGGDDDHHVPALAINGDGRLVVIYGNHNGDNYLAVSTISRDVTSFQAGTLVGEYTYAHPITLADGSVAVFIRKRITPNATYPAGTYTLVMRMLTFVGQPRQSERKSLLETWETMPGGIRAIRICALTA